MAGELKELRDPAIIRSDARSLPLGNASVDLIVTSPPYYGLRSYQDGGKHYATQIGSEPTPGQYIDALIDVTREMVRVLKPTGSMWINLGDKYSGYTNGQGKGRNPGGGQRGEARVPDGPVSAPTVYGIPNKSLMGLPWRYALRCVDDLGLILRAEVIWSKPNGLPESVTDRVRRSHEQWFHFTRAGRYYSAVDEIRQEPVRVDPPRPIGTRNKTPRHTNAADYSGWKDHSVSANALGKLPGSVWEVATQPLTVPAGLGLDHFAAFPMEWPRRIITGWSPREVCTVCGEGRRPATSVERVSLRQRDLPMRARLNGERIHGPDKRAGTHVLNRSTIVGYICSCTDTAAPSLPGVVLDPFGGTGTTALVASALGRRGISVDASGDYCRIARWRCNDPGERAKAAQIEKPPTEIPGQVALFGAAS